ncbi:DUF6265 family protein [Autumnicola musiva]|uniref:DUF6265 family protein n=1 Tax=Autumnicola musiva TaxID=3075589 RepID=A0ABU3D967_9FLAO|nr:DUF6265 family protein [Zunongwangia sp. F117]MDT0678073.1 DUF6265 family protein [Zunongwangia sp. F117]
MRALLHFVIFMVFSFGIQEEGRGQEISTVSFDWLSGNWQRTNDEGLNQTFESWKKNSAMEYSGVGYTLNSGDTIFKENLRIVQKNDKWNLEVSGENEIPVVFPIINFNSHSFTAENKLNEFPKKIFYSFKEGRLTATISAGDTEIPFYFIKSR